MGLYSKIVDLQKLGQAWEKVKSNNPSAGTDQISCAQFDANSRIELKQLNLELYNHEYRVRPVRLVSLEKEEKVREISLYTMRDKVVQTSIAQELNRIYESKFSTCVYAYRNERSAMGAAERIEKEICSGQYSWIAKTDIESFFDRIQVPLLKRKLERVIKEEDVIELIEMELAAPALENGGVLEEKMLGIYQGSSISPVLSNIYLDDFDHMMERESVFYVRYSDDILLLGKSREQLQTVLAKIKILLEPYGLNLKETKTFINPLEQGLEFLGYKFDLNGKTATQKALQRLDQSLEDLWLTQSQLSLEERLKKGTQILNGWEQYYNKEEKIQSISEYVVLVYMLRNKSQLEEFAHRRSEFKNFHRDIAEYLIGVWEENGWKDLVILEYEQYFQIEVSSDETYQELDSYSQREILDSFSRLFQAETEENWSELMQLYADAGRYSQAEKIVDKITKFSEQSESVETLCAEDLPSEEQKEDIETQIQKFNRRLRAEKEIQDAYRNLDQMLGRTNLSDQISDKTEIAKPTNPTLESVSKADFTYDVPKGMPIYQDENALSPKLAENLANSSKSISECGIAAYREMAAADSEITQKALDVLTTMQAREDITPELRMHIGDQITQIISTRSLNLDKIRFGISSVVDQHQAIIVLLGLLATGGAAVVMLLLKLIDSIYGKKR